MAQDETDAAARLAEALAEHRRRHVPFRAPWGDGTKFAGCTCGWELAWPASTQSQPAPPPVETFDHHRAAALLPVVRELGDLRAAEAWDAGYQACYEGVQRFRNPHRGIDPALRGEAGR